MQECRRDRRLTITADDLIVGFANLGLADYVQSMSEYLRLYRENVNQQVVAPRAPPAPPTPVAPTMQEETVVPPLLPSPYLTLQLGLPSVPDIMELTPHTDVYALWPGAASVAAGTSLAPMPPPDADDDDDE
ncbi:uncharacterized protein [Miscanthus floridulus]|uniref:uncharacterized protein n=1 Tax=Miscanthus floridulus TaxID=154761 RepID=UPI003457F317